MAAEIQFIPEVIEKMAKGAPEERTQCPVCRGEKDPRSWICPACFEEHGYGLTLKVRQAVEWAAKMVDKAVFRELLQYCRDIVTSKERPDVTDEELAKDMLNNEKFRKKFPEVSSEATILSAFGKIRRDIRKEVEEKERWQTALAAVKERFKNGKAVKSEFFLQNRVKFGDNGDFITDKMMKDACRLVQEEREKAMKSAANAAFLDGIFK
jgi:hypothetical protein